MTISDFWSICSWWKWVHSSFLVASRLSRFGRSARKIKEEISTLRKGHWTGTIMSVLVITLMSNKSSLQHEHANPLTKTDNWVSRVFPQTMAKVTQPYWHYFYSLRGFVWKKLGRLCHGNDNFPPKYLQQIVVDASYCFDIFPITGSKRRLLWHGGEMHIPVCAKSLVLCLVRTNTIWYTFKYTSIRMWYTMPVATQRRKAYQWGSTLQHLFCT